MTTPRSIGRVKPYVFSGQIPDPNSIQLAAPVEYAPFDKPQPGDTYIDISDPAFGRYWVFTKLAGDPIARWHRVGATSPVHVGPTPPDDPEIMLWFSPDEVC